MDYRFNHFRRHHLFDGLQFSAGQQPGWSLPDFDLPTLNRGRVRKSDFMGSCPALFTFASITDPVAASAAPMLKRLHREFCEAVAFVTVYVRESHPGDHIPQPDTLDAKMRHARMLRERDGIPWTVAVDDLEGTFHRALGANSSAAYLMDPNGNVAFRTLCSNDECVLRHALLAIVGGRTDRPFERGRRLVPIARALAHLDEVVRAAGPGAVEDLRREAPFVYAAAEVAWIWRTLTPLGRVAVALAGALAAASFYGGARLLKQRRYG
jgi:Iodothyronine deiodinase